MNEGGILMARSNSDIDDCHADFWDITSFRICNNGSKLQMKKSHMYAAETALQGAIYFKAYGLTGGYTSI